MIQIPKFGVYEDGILVAMGIYSIIMLIINWKRTGGERLSEGSISSHDLE